MRRKEPAPGLVTVKELVTEQLLIYYDALVYSKWNVMRFLRSNYTVWIIL